VPIGPRQRGKSNDEKTSSTASKPPLRVPQKSGYCPASLGASFGDFLSQPVSNGGLGLGTLGNSALFLTMDLRPITYMSVMQRNASAVHEMHPAS
jgi:hypothetical protein